MLPFQITRMLGFKNKTHGYVLVNEEGIRLVFREADYIKKAWDDDAEFVQIDWDNFAGMDVVRGIISDELKIKVLVMMGDEPDGKNDNIIHLELQKRDRDKLDQFFTGVRELEQRLHMQEEWERKPKVTVDEEVPRDIRDNAALLEKTRSMFHLARLALETDSTRAVTTNTACPCYFPVGHWPVLVLTRLKIRDLE